MTSSDGLKSTVSPTENCMVTGCSAKAEWYCFDGNFWVKCCAKDRIEFKTFAQDNKLKYEERPIPPTSKEAGILGGSL